MKRVAIALALTGSCVLATPSLPLQHSRSKPTKPRWRPAKPLRRRRRHVEAFGDKRLKPGQYVWRDVPEAAGPERLSISLSDQLAYLYRGDTLVAATTISTGRDEKPTPDRNLLGPGQAADLPVEEVRQRADAVAQFFDQHGIALHAGSCRRTVRTATAASTSGAFAKKLYSITDVGTPVYIGA